MRMAPNQMIATAGEVHHQEHRRHQQRDEPVDRDRGVGQVEIGGVEARLS